MTFAQWYEATNAAHRHEADGRIRVFEQPPGGCRGLFRLSDYRVLSAESGPSYVLIPRAVIVEDGTLTG
jgi:hypothetical protein